VAFGAEHNILIVHDNPYSFVRNKNRLSIFQVPVQSGLLDRLEIGQEVRLFVQRVGDHFAAGEFYRSAVSGVAGDWVRAPCRPR